MSTGSALAFGGLLVDQGWSGTITPQLRQIFPGSAWLAAHAEKFPVNGQVIYFIAMLSASLLYILISLLGPRQRCDMDKLLHRGAYALPEDELAGSVHQRHSWREMLGLTREFTRGDRIVFWSTVAWSIGWWLIFLGGCVYDRIWGTTGQMWSWFWWGKIWLSAILCIAFTAWFSFGGVRDSIDLFRTLKARRAAKKIAPPKDTPAVEAVLR
jgi:SSS family solute:Na+ symporter